MTLPEIDDIMAAPQPYFYRNKMEYAFSDQRWLTADEIADKSLIIEKKGLGFHKSGNVGQGRRHPPMPFASGTGQ